MGCVCCSIGSFVSIILDALERISLCTVCALLTCCLLMTLLTVLVLGIGIGFNYCHIQNAVDTMDKADKAAGAFRSGPGRSGSGGVMRSVDRAVKRGFAHRVARREADVPSATNNNDNSTNLTEIGYTTISNVMNISKAVII